MNVQQNFIFHGTQQRRLISGIKLIEENRLTIKKCLKQLVENASGAYLDRVIDKEIQFEEKHPIADPTLVDQTTTALVKKLKSIEVDLKSFLTSFNYLTQIA